MIKEAIVKIVNKGDLTYDEAYAVMNEIMSGETSPTQNAAFLAALSTKSARAETTDEIAGCAAAMRDHATKVQTDMELFEIVGTGGDNAHSFNISTTSALVAAAGGMKVAKHGNRAASSQCGTADCLEALGVNIEQSPERCKELLQEVGMCFFFAQKYHTSMKYVGAIRKELGFRTVFNILGPLTNPGSPKRQLLGVYDEYLVEPLAQVLISLGVERGMVVYGQDKLDELSTPKGDFPFEKALRKPGISFICECKKASPSKGLIAPDFPYLKIAREYETAGADCISVLTEPKWFLGSDVYLREIVQAVSVPCLRKDFTVDEYMIYEAKVLGASAVLLICSILSEEQIREYLAVCETLGLSALVEAHDEEEVAKALRAGARIIGVNNRNLKDFTVDTNNSRRLRALIPAHILFVSESGVQGPEDVKRLAEVGVDAVLVGEALMRAEDKKAMLARLRG